MKIHSPERRQMNMNPSNNNRFNLNPQSGKSAIIMDFHETQQQQKQQQQMKRPQKKRLTQEQVRVLERSFSFNKKLFPELKSELASQLGVPPRQVAIWYQNKRARWKTQTLELDHNTLELKLQNAAVNKRRLEKEVARLHHELSKAQDTVVASVNHCRHGGCTTSSTIPPANLLDHHHLPPAPITIPAPSDVDQHYDDACPPMKMNPCGSSSDINFNNIHGRREEVNLQLEDELYASFVMGGNSGSSGSTCSWD